MARNSTFTKNSATYVCTCCGHLTRNTGEQSLDSKTCPICWDLAGLENEEQDGILDDSGKAEINGLFAAIGKRSEAELAKALKSFDLIAKYYNANATTEDAAPAKQIEMLDASTVKGPVAECKAIFAAHPGIARKEFVALAIERGVCKATAGTQYNRIKKGA